MKKGTAIAFLIALIYCSMATYVAMTMKVNYKGGPDTYSDLVEILTIPGGLIGFIGLHLFGMPAFIFGQIISFTLIFYILKTILNWFINKLQKQKP